MIRNRVREHRKRRGLTLEQLAERTGLSVSQLSRIEKHDRGWSVTSLPKIAAALGVQVGELLDVSNAWQDVPVFGSIGETTWARFKTTGKSKAIVQLPAAIGNVLAVTITGGALYPRYMEGEVLAVTEASVDPATAAGRECLIGVDTGYFALKVVQPSTERGKTMLTSHNEPPMNREIVSCRPVVFVSRA